MAQWGECGDIYKSLTINKPNSPLQPSFSHFWLILPSMFLSQRRLLMVLAAAYRTWTVPIVKKDF